MVNIQYRRGRAKEYRIRDSLVKEGYKIVFRSAGSHSPIDVIAIKEDEILFIQSKPKKFSKKKAQKIKDELQWLNGLKNVRFEVR